MFNERLRSTRKLRKFKLQQMADMLEISLRAYQHYEQGERCPSLDCLVKIADILEVYKGGLHCMCTEVPDYFEH